MFCTNCGNQISDAANFCNECGTKVVVPNNVQLDTNPTIFNHILKPRVEWKSIPAGTFTMGSPETEIDRMNEPEHRVTLTAFQISKYEVTFEEYDLFCEATGREKPNDNGWGREKHPVINVDWNDATAFAAWMGCRLPTEAEWEYACRAGTTTPFNTGNNITALEANYKGDSPYSNYEKGEYREKTTPVGSFRANAWQLYDMHGNVDEWCNDWHSESAYYDDQTDPQGPETGNYRVFRGGSWKCDAEFCRSATRFRCCYNQNKSVEIGFRLAKSW